MNTYDLNKWINESSTSFKFIPWTQDSHSLKEVTSYFFIFKIWWNNGHVSSTNLVPPQSRTVGAESLHFYSRRYLQMFATIKVFVSSSSWRVVIYDLVFIFKWNFILVRNLSSTLIAVTIKKNVSFDLLNNVFYFLADAIAFQDN